MAIEKIFIRPRKAIPITAVVIFSLSLRLINLNQSFWLDEAAQVIESVRPLSQQLDIVADFHPPLFHLLLHFWMYLGRSEIWVRLLSVFLSVASVLLIYKLAESIRKKSTGILAAFFLSLSPYHIWYSQEARPYMLFLFTSLLSTYFLLKKRWFLYTLAITLTWFSLYFAPFQIIGHGVYMLFFEKKAIRSWLANIFLSLMVFAAWIPMFLRQFSVGTGGFFPGWTHVVSIPTAKAILMTFAKFIFGRGSIENNLLYTLVVLPMFLLFCWSCWFIIKNKRNKKLLILFFIPFLSSIIVSLFIPILAPQRLIFLLPFFLLIVAVGISSLKGNARWIAFALVVSTSMTGLIQYWFDPKVQREQWRQAVEFVESSTVDQSIALFVFPEPFAPYLWYQKGKIDTIGIAPDFKVADRDLSRLEKSVANYNKIYLFQYLTGLTDPQDETRLFLEKSGFFETSVNDFPGVGFVYVYEKAANSKNQISNK